ncbi:MAG TPA: bifunctional UDP-N-acetylglucosamine diphosphorylase/glucosamine-1-phosphate N-acetyltransferase GlmU [Armatimonadota bacterium]|jgi:bifunctional UDP-N-acetylglucosamine pyrophosphorylase/glucosamine-1-phosphate N-acetyltransferase
MSETKPVVALIMAAGKSTRMKSRTPKVLHRVAGRAVVDYIVQAAQEGCGVQRTIAIVGHEADRVREYLTSRWGEDMGFALQSPQNGTGHAVMQAEPLLQGFDGDVLTLAGDTPLVTSDVLRSLLEHHRISGATATVLTAVMENPGAYGRVVRTPAGAVARIVEAKDATAEEKAIGEINTSIYCFRSEPLFRALARIRPENAQGEYYLTDVIALLAADGERVEAVVSPDPAVVMGVNTRSELAIAADAVRRRTNKRLMLSGVTIIDPANTYIDVEVAIGPDTVIYPGCVIEGATTIGSDCVIGPHTHLVDCALGDDVRCEHSKANLVEMADHSRVGPFAHLRPGTSLAEEAKIGSFVELKKATVGRDVHISHLTYAGDVTIGDNSNIGGGTITCNFDGRKKNPTTIGSNVFVGSNNTLVAPVTIGDGAYTAAGSVITEDVPADALALGRARQVVKEGWAAERRDRPECS